MKAAVSLNQNVPKKPARDYKGESLITFPESYIVLDLETTGLSPRRDEIIEIGAIKVKDGRAEGHFHSLIKPTMEINNFITRMTGISNEMVADAPRIGEVIPPFESFIGDYILVGHNVHFDINLLYDNFQRELGWALTNDFVDCLRLAKRLLP